jgi:hypothetical protein
VTRSNGHGDREERSRPEEPPAREDIMPRGPMMNPDRARLLAGGGGGGGNRGGPGQYNGGPPRDDRYGRR